MVGGVGVTFLNWYCLRAANLKKDHLLPEEIEGKYNEQQLSEMGEYSPYFRYEYTLPHSTLFLNELKC